MPRLERYSPGHAAKPAVDPSKSDEPVEPFYGPENGCDAYPVPQRRVVESAAKHGQNGQDHVSSVEELRNAMKLSPP